MISLNSNRTISAPCPPIILTTQWVERTAVPQADFVWFLQHAAEQGKPRDADAVRSIDFLTNDPHAGGVGLAVLRVVVRAAAVFCPVSWIERGTRGSPSGRSTVVTEGPQIFSATAVKMSRGFERETGKTAVPW